MSSLQFNISESVQRSVECGMQKGMENAATSLVNDVVKQLAEKYGQIDVNEAMEMLGVTLSTKPAKANAAKKPKKSKKSKKSKESDMKLPWCGEVLPNCCQAIQQCNKLYIQCRNYKLEDGDYCKRCQTKTTSNGGTPIYGVIQDRFDADYIDKDGKKPINYGNYLKTVNKNAANKITQEDVEAEAAKLGWTIPPEQFEVVVMRKGRKPGRETNVEASDTDDDIVAKIAKEAKEKGELTDDSSDDDSSDDEAPLGIVVAKKEKEKDAKQAAKEAEGSELEADIMNESGEESE